PPRVPTRSPASRPGARSASWPRRPTDRRRLDPEDGIAAGDAPQLLVRRDCAKTFEEACDLEPPAREVRSQHRRLVRVGQLEGAKRLAMPPEPQLPAAGNTNVPDPLRLASRRDEKRHAADLEQVHRHDAPVARFPPPDGQISRSVEADPGAREQAGNAIEDPVSPRQSDVPTIRHGADHSSSSGRAACETMRTTIVRQPSCSSRDARASGSAASAITAPPAPPPVSFAPSAPARRAAATSAAVSSDETPSDSSNVWLSPKARPSAARSPARAAASPRSTVPATASKSSSCRARSASQRARRLPTAAPVLRARPPYAMTSGRGPASSSGVTLAGSPRTKGKQVPSAAAAGAIPDHVPWETAPRRRPT